MRKLLIILLSAFTFSCNLAVDDRPDLSDVKVDVKVKRLEQEMFALKNKEELRKFIKSHPALSHEFFQVDQYPNDSVLVNALFQLINDPYIDTLYRETEDRFGDFSDIKAQFTQAFRHIKYYYPEFKAPIIYTMITGFGRDLFVSDSIIILGLDYYVGKEATYRPLDIPKYILTRYEKEYIVPTCVLLMSSKYNKVNVQAPHHAGRYDLLWQSLLFCFQNHA